MPWTYSSGRSTNLPLNNVTFASEDEHTLVIALDLVQWLDDALEPIQAAVAEVETEELTPTDTQGEFVPVDVSSDLEEKGAAIENLNAWSEVQSRKD